MSVQLQFVASSDELFDREEPIFHVLFEKIETLILTLAARIYTAEILLNLMSDRLKSVSLFKYFICLPRFAAKEDSKHI